MIIAENAQYLVDSGSFIKNRIVMKNNKNKFSIVFAFVAACNSKNNEDHSTHQSDEGIFILVQWIRRLRKISLKMPHLSHGFNPMKKDNSASNEIK
jgi:hypothetical protein